jgi:hypothetical protein
MEQLSESILGKIFNKDKWHQKGYKTDKYESFSHYCNLTLREQCWWPALFVDDYSMDGLDKAVGGCANDYFVDDKQTIANRVLAWLPSIMTPLGKKVIATYPPKCEINLFQYKTKPIGDTDRGNRSIGYIAVGWDDCNIPLIMITANEPQKKSWSFWWDR